MEAVNLKFDFLKMSFQEILEIIQKYKLSITVKEAKKMQTLFQKFPSLSECILWGIHRSEHCSYKSSRIYLNTLPKKSPNILLKKNEDAGIISIAYAKENKEYYGIAISHESHNHPSQIVPFEGAATGIGGNVRDVCCMGATVIANADSLRFGSLYNNKINSSWIYENVINGIASYSNALGVPNIFGDVQFDSRYNNNCLVTAITIGIVKKSEIIHSYLPKNSEDYDIILVGKKTDASGFGGATFSSINLKKNQKDCSAVQEPNAFLGRILLQSNYELFKKIVSLKKIKDVAFKDLGAGGIACATSELIIDSEYGAEIYIDKVHVLSKKIDPTIILCSETQERYIWACPSELTSKILQHYNEEFELPKISNGACARIIGKINKKKKYRVKFKNHLLIDIEVKNLKKEIFYNKNIKKPILKFTEPKILSKDIVEIWIKIISHPNVSSDIDIFERYDKQVQGRTLIERGNADSGVFIPFNGTDFPESIRNIAIALSVSGNPRFGKIDPYWASVNAVISSMGSIISVGATPEGITDCLCFGNPENPENMYELVNSIKGIKDVCENIHLLRYPSFPTPVISGNVSLHNVFQEKAIPASPIISCIGRIENFKKTINRSFKEINNFLILIGDRKNECGGSIYYEVFDELGKNIPKPDFILMHKIFKWIHTQISDNNILSASWIGNGGLAATLTRMSIANEIGFSIKLPGKYNKKIELFSETPGFLLEIHFSKLKFLENFAKKMNIPFFILGNTIQEKKWYIEKNINIDLIYAKKIWFHSLKKLLLTS